MLRGCGMGLGLALIVGAAPAAAQDIPWDKSAPNKSAPKKAPAKKAPPAAPAPKANKAPPIAPAPKAAPAKAAPAKAAPAKRWSPPKAAHAAPTTKQTQPSSPGAAGAQGEPPAKTDFAGLLDHFKHQLKPHGAWIEHPTYGSIWIPHESEVGKGFTPYRTDGRWAVTDEGQWAWVSDQDWGRIPFHYGRWVWTKDKSWAWVPDREHAPAWVVWRLPEPGNNHVGWAPMPPSHIYRDGDKQPLERGVLAFNYVPSRHLFKPGLERHVVTDARLGERLQERSTVFDGNMRQGRKGLAPILPATPTFDAARIPGFAIPQTRLSAGADPIKPIVLAMLKTVEAPADGASKANAPDADAEQADRFATPPDEGAAEGGEPAAADATSVKGVRQGDSDKPRYRCWWTNTRPRIWRCGY